MGSVPAYAAIAQTVELAKRRHGIGASKLANAVLRASIASATRSSIADAGGSRRGARARVLASALARRALGRAVGCSRRRERLLDGEQRARRRSSLRPYRTSCASSSRRCSRARASTSATRRSCATASCSRGGVALTELGAFKQGLFFVQDPASTLVTRYAAIPDGRTRRRSVRGAGRQGARALAHGRRRLRGRRVVRATRSACARTCGASTRRNIIPFVGDARIPRCAGWTRC